MTLTVLAALLGVALISVEARTFVNKDGKRLEAEIVAKTETHVTLKTAKGEYSVLISSLSEKDQAYVNGWKDEAAMAEDLAV